MSRRPFAAFAAVIALCSFGFTLGGPSEVRAQCLDRTACAEIRAEAAKLRPDVRLLRQRIRQARRALQAFEPGGDRWLAKRAQLRRLKKESKSLKRELRALKQDFRHNSCSSC